ncbi:MAG: hypothetical protein ABR608_07315 [Pseudonocardiaceae bacterium]
MAVCAGTALGSATISRRPDPNTGPDGDRIGVFGSLMCNAASAAARGGHAERAEEHLQLVVEVRLCPQGSAQLITVR